MTSHHDLVILSFFSVDRRDWCVIARRNISCIKSVVYIVVSFASAPYLSSHMLCQRQEDFVLASLRSPRDSSKKCSQFLFYLTEEGETSCRSQFIKLQRSCLWIWSSYRSRHWLFSRLQFHQRNAQFLFLVLKSIVSNAKITFQCSIPCKNSWSVFRQALIYYCLVILSLK